MNSSINFRKAFFPTEEEKEKQKDLLNNIHEIRILEYINQGLSRLEAETMINKEVEEFKQLGYYS